MSVPNTFASATSAIPLANLDANFAYYDAAYSIASSTVTYNYKIALTGSTTASTNVGLLNYGTLGFNDTGIVQAMQTSVNSYFQSVIQNTNNGAAASAEFIVYNDGGTATTNYAAFGINSSGYTGTGSINTAGYSYFISASTDLVLGTVGANAIHLTTNSAATDAITISSANAVSLPGGTANGVAYLNGSKVITSGSVLTFDGTTLSSTNFAGALNGTVGATTPNAGTFTTLTSTGAILVNAPTPASISGAATLTNANIQTQLINTTGTTYTVTMPLGTTLETLVTWPAINLGYDFSIVNTASGTITLAVNTGVTAVGGLTVAAGASNRYRIRRTAANTFVLYRIS